MNVLANICTGGGKILLRNRKTQGIKGIAALSVTNISDTLAHCGIVRSVRVLYMRGKSIGDAECVVPTNAGILYNLTF